jgi:hypothetical protein
MHMLTTHQNSVTWASEEQLNSNLRIWSLLEFGSEMFPKGPCVRGLGLVERSRIFKRA